MNKLYENVANRYIKASRDNRILMNEELEILKHLVSKFGLMTISEYAKKEKITYKGAKIRILSGKVMYINLMNKTFVIQ